MNKSIFFQGILPLLCFFSFATVQAQDAVAVSKLIVGPATIFETGVVFQYDVTVRCDNQGAESCSNFILTETLPPGMEFSSLTASQVFSVSGAFANPTITNFDQGGDPSYTNPGTITMEFGNVPPGSSGVIRFTVRFQTHGTIPDGYTVFNTAMVSSDNDSDTGNNTVTDLAGATAQAEEDYTLDKRLQNSILDGLTTYGIRINLPGATGAYFSGHRGKLALYNPVVIDILELGLTCADIDPATTTGYIPGNTGNSLCLLPNETVTLPSGVMFTNPSATNHAIAFDIEAITANPDPYYTNAVCPSTDATLVDCEPVVGTSNQFIGANGYSVNVGVYYSTPTFMATQLVTNNAELWASLPTALGGTTISPIGLLVGDDASHELAAASPSATISKNWNNTTVGKDSTYVGNITSYQLTSNSNGNVPVDIVVTDTLPAEYDLNNITPAGADTIKVFYTDGSIETFIEPTTTVTITKPAGEYASIVQIIFNDQTERVANLLSGTILAQRWRDDRTTAATDNTVEATDDDLGTQLAGSPVAFGEEMTNRVNMTYSYLDVEVGSEDRFVLTHITNIYTQGSITKSGPSPLADIGDVITFSITPFINASRFVDDITIVDTLPEFLSYVSTTYVGPACSRSTHAISFSTAPDGREIVTYVVAKNPGETGDWVGCRIQLNVEVNDGHIAGTFENTVFLTDYTSSVFPLIKLSGSNTVSILDENGFTTPRVGSAPNDLSVPPPYNASDATYRVAATPSGTSVKLVDGDISPGISTSGGVEFASPGSMATFTLVFINDGNEPLVDLRMVDLLPLEGIDFGPLTCGPRNSEWTPDFSGGITANVISGGVTTAVTPDIQYSTDPDPCIEYYVPGVEPCEPCVSGAFSTTPPVNLSDVRGLGIDFSGLVVLPGDSVLISFNVDVPLTPAPEGIAWNTFVWRADGEISGSEIGAEPPLVGLASEEFDMALAKTLNSASVAPFMTGDIITFDLLVINQGAFTALDIDVVDNFVTTDLDFIGFTVPAMTTGGATVGATLTDTDGSDGQVGLEIDAIPELDTVIIQVAFELIAISAPGATTTIRNTAEITAAGLFDGGNTVYDSDSEFDMIGGNGANEVDDDVADNSTGGTDIPEDQDDFDFAEIEFFTCDDVLAIAGDQDLCEGDDPAAFTITTPAVVGGTATIYQWQSSTTSLTAGFADLSGEMATTYDAPAITDTTYYRLIAMYSCPGTCACSDTSNVVTLTYGTDALDITASASCADALGMQVAANTYFIEVSAVTGGNDGPYDVTVAGVTQSFTGTSLSFGPFNHSGIGGAVQLVSATDNGTGVTCEAEGLYEVPEVLCGINDGGQASGCFCAGPTTDPLVPTSFILVQSQPGTFQAGGTSGQIQKYVLVNDLGFIVAMNLTGLFETPVAGTYTPYAINYRADEDPTVMNFLIVGQPIQPVLDGVNGNGPLAGICFSACNITDPPVMYTTCSCYSVGSTVFADTNNDGMLTEANENGLPGIVVELYNDGDDPLTDDPIGTATTDSNGDYYFGGLDPGDYFINLPATPTGLPNSSTVTDNMDNGEDNDDNGIQSMANAPTTSPVFTLGNVEGEPSGAAESGTGGTQDDAADLFGDMTQDFGFFAPVTVGDTTFVDVDMDGTQSMGDLPLENVTVTIYDFSTGLPVAFDAEGGTYTSTQTTDAMGAYLFENLPPGSYYVEFDISTVADSEYYDFTTPNVGDDAEDSDATPATPDADVASSGNTGQLLSGQSDLTLDAGIACAIIVTVAEPSTICSTQRIDLTQGASISPLSLGGFWSTPDGTGTFTDGGGATTAAPYAFGVTTTYVPSAADAQRGSVTFVLVTNDPVTGPCEAVSAMVTIEVLQVDCGSFFWDGQ